MIKKIFSRHKKSWIYSLISMLNVACGLAVTVLIWYQYSASQESDILLLAISSISILSQLSLVGVEQVLYFYSDERKKGTAAAEKFFRLAFSWSLMSGLVFASLFALASQFFLQMVAPGMGEPHQGMAKTILLAMSPQLIISPALHVLRAKWALNESFGRAYLLSAFNSLVVLASLLVTIFYGQNDLHVYAQVSFLISITLLVAFTIHYRKDLIWPHRQDWNQIKMLIRHSTSMKGANSVHNFLLQALLSSLLSKMPVGSISIYQYAKKLADGVFAITAGPQVMIYHTKCAHAISHWNLTEMKENALHYLKTFLSFFFVMALIIFAAAPLALAILGKNFSTTTIEDIRQVYVGHFIWYLIMGIETIAVGVILATHKSVALLRVNLTFIALFYLWTRVHMMTSVLELILTTAAFQIVSFILFSWSALIIIQRRGARAS